MASTTTLLDSTSALSISNIEINKAQQEAEQTPSDPILPPQPNRTYEVDKSVKAYEMIL